MNEEKRGEGKEERGEEIVDSGQCPVVSIPPSAFPFPPSKSLLCLRYPDSRAIGATRAPARQ